MIFQYHVIKLSCHFMSSRTISTEENCSSPTPKLTLTQTPTLTEGQFSSGGNCLVVPNPKTNVNFDANPNPNREIIFLEGQLFGYRFYGWEALMVSHHPANFGGHRHCGSGDMFLVAKEENSRCSRFNSPLLFNF